MKFQQKTIFFVWALLAVWISLLQLPSAHAFPSCSLEAQNFILRERQNQDALFSGIPAGSGMQFTRGQVPPGLQAWGTTPEQVFRALLASPETRWVAGGSGSETGLYAIHLPRPGQTRGKTITTRFRRFQHPQHPEQFLWGIEISSPEVLAGSVGLRVPPDLPADRDPESTFARVLASSGGSPTVRDQRGGASTPDPATGLQPGRPVSSNNPSPPALRVRVEPAAAQATATSPVAPLEFPTHGWLAPLDVQPRPLRWYVPILDSAIPSEPPGGVGSTPPLRVPTHAQGTPSVLGERELRVPGRSPRSRLRTFQLFTTPVYLRTPGGAVLHASNELATQLIHSPNGTWAVQRRYPSIHPTARLYDFTVYQQDPRTGAFGSPSPTHVYRVLRPDRAAQWAETGELRAPVRAESYQSADVVRHVRNGSQGAVRDTTPFISFTRSLEVALRHATSQECVGCQVVAVDLSRVPEAVLIDLTQESTRRRHFAQAGTIGENYAQASSEVLVFDGASTAAIPLDAISHVFDPNAMPYPDYVGTVTTSSGQTLPVAWLGTRQYTQLRGRPTLEQLGR